MGRHGRREWVNVVGTELVKMVCGIGLTWLTGNEVKRSAPLSVKVLDGDVLTWSTGMG